MKFYLIISFCVIAVDYSKSEPPPPRSRYIPPGPPPSLAQKYGLPLSSGLEKYLPPPSNEYGSPLQQNEYPSSGHQQLQPHYGPPQPSQEYGPPSSQLSQKLITKNVYIHVPPEETTIETTPKNPIRLQQPKKHYKIIFIKAPTPPTPTAPVIPEQLQDEHKTLVYVLVKKPEPAPQIVIPSAPPTEPSKPEVYFIKYKNGENKKLSTHYGPPNSY